PRRYPEAKENTNESWTPSHYRVLAITGRPGKHGASDDAGPRAPAFEIWRESAGIPHIRAKSDAAAWEGLGCVHVRDRLFQMDLTRRRAFGRVAEWAGPEALPGDRFARRAGCGALARKNHAGLGDEARATLDAYARGANAEIARQRAAGQLPREYALLHQPEGPEPWQPWDSNSLLRHDDGRQDRFVPPPGTYGKRWVAAATTGRSPAMSPTPASRS
uniref:penicillin acylase family protein n=1 Tax=uncultured Salipiger sp. TaxID=499810 RepID=UPI0025980482